MKWEASIKRSKPKLGDKREIIRFSFFPTRVESKWLWFEKYTVIQEYQEWCYTYDEVVSEGLIYEKYRERVGTAEGWRTIERRLLT